MKTHVITNQICLYCSRRIAQKSNDERNTETLFINIVCEQNRNFSCSLRCRCCQVCSIFWPSLFLSCCICVTVQSSIYKHSHYHSNMKSLACIKSPDCIYTTNKTQLTQSTKIEASYHYNNTCAPVKLTEHVLLNTEYEH